MSDIVTFRLGGGTYMATPDVRIHGDAPVPPSATRCAVEFDTNKWWSGMRSEQRFPRGSRFVDEATAAIWVATGVLP